MAQEDGLHVADPGRPSIDLDLARPKSPEIVSFWRDFMAVPPEGFDGVCLRSAAPDDIEAV
jgi:hypothetical protein